MAVDYLRLIQVFAESTGARKIFSAPVVNKPLVSIPLGDGRQSAHFIYDISLSKRVLRDSDIFIQDHFLDRLLSDCDPDKVNWVQLFVESSPEFLDGPQHTTARALFKRQIDRFVATVSEKSAQEISSIILCELESQQATSLGIAKSIIRLRFKQILENELNCSVTVDDDLLFGPEIFTPSVRIKSSVYKLNWTTDNFINSFVDPDKRNDTAFILSILSLFYMASTPILASCTALLNSLVNEERIQGEVFVDFEMVPTNYVAREASSDVDLLGTKVRSGDKLYIMLFESSGCPFSKEKSLPFGYGKHLCPGAALSKLIIGQCLAAISDIPSEKWRALSPSSIQQGRGSAFLAYEDC
jgi:hypothetical protein